jgi:flagellar motor switch protein FliG
MATAIAVPAAPVPAAVAPPAAPPGPAAATLAGLPAPAIPGVRKAAILTLLLGEEGASHVFKHLQEDEIERIAREVAALGAVQGDVRTGVLEEFNAMWQAADYVNRGGVEFAQKLLVRTLGPEMSRRIIERVVKSLESTLAFNSLEKADPQQLSKFVLSEHPQTIALILAHLKPAQAAQLLNSLPEDLRADVLTRMASLDEISPEVISRISAVIEQRLKSVGGATHESYGGVRAVAEVLNRLDRTVSQPVLEAIENQSPDLAVSIRNLMFVFDDLLQVEDSALREIIQRADKKVLTIALKGASEDIRTRFYTNMSKRAAEMIKEEMEVLGAIRLREVEKAQQEVVAIARKLEEEGLLTTGAAAGEPYVV